MTVLNGVKRQLKRQVNAGKIVDRTAPFTRHAKIYLSTNENVAAYANLIKEIDARSALTVLASGDQTFNLVANNVYDIDTFDTNHITEYYVLGLRRAMVAKYHYVDFLVTSEKLISKDTSLEEISDIVMGLLGFMDEPYRTFWYKFVNYNYKIQKNKKTHLNPFILLSMDDKMSLKDITYGNNYLESEEAYNNFRHLLGHANITFKPANALKLEKSFSGKYDAILLSNILDFAYFSWSQYFGYNHIEEYLAKIKPMLNDDGLLFLYYNFTDSRNPIMGDSYVLERDLTEEEIITFPSKIYNGNDSMLLVRKKGVI